MNRKYNQFQTRGDINVSSSGHYFIDVFYGKDGRGDTGYFCLNDNQFMRGGREPGPIKMPKYIIEGAVKAIAEGLRSGKLSFYEYNRDGQKRYDNLRYHDPEMVEIWLKRNDPEGEGR